MSGKIKTTLQLRESRSGPVMCLVIFSGHRQDSSGFGWRYTWQGNKFGPGYKRESFQPTAVGTKKRFQDVLL